MLEDAKRLTISRTEFIKSEGPRWHSGSTEGRGFITDTQLLSVCLFQPPAFVILDQHVPANQQYSRWHWHTGDGCLQQSHFNHMDTSSSFLGADISNIHFVRKRKFNKQPVDNISLKNITDEATGSLALCQFQMLLPSFYGPVLGRLTRLIPLLGSPWCRPRH